MLIRATDWRDEVFFMTTRKITLAPADFFHARPAGRFAAAAAQYESMVMVLFGSAFADGKSAISLMRLPRFHGAAFELAADGPDETQAVRELEALLADIF